MKTATVKQLKDELKFRSQSELLEICLRLSKFKKENKELLTYLLFETHDEEGYIAGVKKEMDLQFDQINTSNFYYIKKSVRKVLRELKKYARYSGKKETEAELLIYFLVKLEALRPSIHRNKVLKNLYDRQFAQAKKKIASLHEDLQFDLNKELEELK